MKEYVLSLRGQLKTEGVLTLSVRLRPGASRNAFVAQLDDGSVKIDIASPPTDNRANVELVAFLAKELEVSPGQIEIVSGMTARRKLIRVRSE